jgi:hypothetical protein
MAGSQSFREQLASRVVGSGAIYHGHSDVANKGKWIAVLNGVWPPIRGVVVYAFFTTKAGRFQRARIPASAYLTINVGEYSFVTEPTILDLTDLKTRPLEEILRAALFKFEGHLTEEHLRRVHEIVAKSTYVSPVNRKLVLGLS